MLDAASTGPRFLQRPKIAKLLVSALKAGDREFRRYQLHAFVVMANHVHLLVTPRVPSPKWLGPLKGFTAHRANEVLHTPGKHFWQEESHDHMVRNVGEFERIRRYIELNPVKAGLATSIEDFLYSGAG